MQRLSEKHKRWHARRTYFSHRRSLRRRYHRKSLERYVPTERKLILPETLSFEENYVETNNFFIALRRAAERPRDFLEINFTTLRNIGPAAALVLASELHCWQLNRLRRIRVVDIEDWHPGIAVLLYQMGLFGLVNVVNPPVFRPTPNFPLHFIRFRSDKIAVGSAATRLRTDLEKLTGKIPSWSHLYRGLTEAMTNVRQHAYPDSLESNAQVKTNRWWMFGAFAEDQKILTCVFFDRGVGIPATLPNKFTMEHLASFFEKFGLTQNDASMIEAAMELGRTQTGARHQGRGLADIKHVVGQTPNGKLRILSGRGQYTFAGKDPADTKTLPSSIDGTLIQWEITLTSNREESER